MEPLISDIYHFFVLSTISRELISNNTAISKGKDAQQQQQKIY